MTPSFLPNLLPSGERLIVTGCATMHNRPPLTVAQTQVPAQFQAFPIARKSAASYSTVNEERSRPPDVNRYGDRGSQADVDGKQ